jgi:glycosyltransferase involved in cell wall biosynthesis
LAGHFQLLVFESNEELMKIHGICLVKNEGDFLARSLEANVEHFDGIYIYDNGSDDGTWESAMAMEKKHAGRIIAWRTEDRPFRDELRGEVFNAFRDRANPGDWWCRLDADEIYIDPVREFLAKVPNRHHVIWSLSHQYYFTTEDASRWEEGPVLPGEDLEDLPRHYLINHSEMRFFRHRDKLRWVSGSWQTHVGIVHPRRIRLKHYQYRSPEQIQKRLISRRLAAERGYRNFGHSLEENWTDKITPVEGLLSDPVPDSKCAEPAALPNHMEPLKHRLVKYLMHGTGLWA